MAHRALACVPAAVCFADGCRSSSWKPHVVHAETVPGKHTAVQCQGAATQGLLSPAVEHITGSVVVTRFRQATLHYLSNFSRGQRIELDITKEHVCNSMNNYSVEVTPAAARNIKDFRTLSLRPHTAVNVTYLPNSKPEETVEVCRRLVDAELDPVAHVPARSFADLAEVDKYFEALRSAGVQRILVLGGGAAAPRGNLTETMEILDSGLVTRHGFSSVGVAAHPEGHPDVAEEVLMEALVRKVRWAREHGVHLYFATQFCFEPEPIMRWEAKVRELLQRELGVEAASLPRIHLGVAGPAKIANLIKFATMSGVGESMQFVTKHTGNAMKLMSTAAPDELIVGIASYQASDADCLISAMHFYPFGGVQKTVNWANQVESGSFSFAVDGKGFEVE